MGRQGRCPTSCMAQVAVRPPNCLRTVRNAITLCEMQRGLGIYTTHPGWTEGLVMGVDAKVMAGPLCAPPLPPRPRPGCTTEPGWPKGLVMGVDTQVMAGRLRALASPPRP